ncbi:MAG: response regulator [bacterium]
MGKKVLIVQSHLDTAIEWRKSLLTVGMETRVETTGLSGIRACHEWHPDCLLMDEELFDMKGKDVVDALGGDEAPCAAAIVVSHGEEPVGFEAAPSVNGNGNDHSLSSGGIVHAIEHAIERFEAQRSHAPPPDPMDSPFSIAPPAFIKNGAIGYDREEPLPMTDDERRELEKLRAELTQSQSQLQTAVTEKQELETSQDRLAALLSNVPGVIYSCGCLPDRVIHFLSPSIKELVNYTTEELEKTSLRQMMHPQEADSIHAQMQEQLDHNGCYDLEYRFLRRDGATVWVSDKGRQVLDERGNVIFLEGILSDITEKRSVEEERVKASKLESIGLMAGGIAHDLNNILTTICANVQLGLVEFGRGEPIEKRLKVANEACLSAADLAKQLLMLSKGDEPAKKATDIGNLIRTAVTFSLHGSKLLPRFGIEEGLMSAEVDATQIGQVINNLVINADQAMPHGGYLSVSAVNHRQESAGENGLAKGEYVRISVRDEGEGISPEHLSRIFDPYFTTKKRGSGLGLTTSQSIVKRHNGRIAVQSELGKGTQFDIFLPALPPVVETQETPLLEEELQPKGGQRILLMDDSENIRIVVGHLLETMGYQVSLARHGEEALDMYLQGIASNEPYDFVMLDLTIPGGMGGKEVIQQLREINPDVAAIVVSGYTDDEFILNCKENGFRAALTKPFTLKAVKEALAQVEAEAEMAVA